MRKTDFSVRFKRFVRAGALPATLAMLAALSPPASAEAGLSVIVTGLKQDGAMLRCALFAKSDGFPAQAAATTTAAGTISAGKGVCQFDGAPTGTLAIAAYEDGNGNNKLDTNALGIPKEAYAFSRDARGRFGPPKFDAAAFAYGGGPMEISLKAEY